LIRLVSDRSIWVFLGHSPTKRDAEGNVTERDEITVLDIDTINWAVVEIGHIDRTEILKNQLISLTDEFALLAGDMRTCEPQITLGPSPNKGALANDLNAFSHSGASEDLYKQWSHD